ncbi:MAG TPA: biotin/lipoyl-containing protein, partial [Pengzhenrongella sp.]
MSDSVQMPALGESVTEGTVTRWLKNVGDTVALDEPLLEVSTDKVDTEIPSPFAGILEQILVQEDETVGVGVALAVIGSGEGAAGGSTENESAPAEERQAEQAPAEEEPAAPEAEQAELTPQAPPVAEQVFGARADGAPVTMPALGESVTEGTVTRWLKNVGDTVALDEPLLEISTDKVDTEIPSPFAGTLQQILVQEDETVEVGTLLAVIGAGAGAVSSAATPTAVQPQAPAQAPAPAPASRPDSAPIVAPVVGQPDSAVPLVAPGGPPTASGSYLTPLVRKLAAEKHVDLTSVTGTGVGGRIRKE